SLLDPSVLTDLAAGGGAGGGLPSFPSTGTPLDSLTSLLDPSSLPISSGASPLDALTSALPTDSLPI
ncbi:hypothetical protein, partial [Limnobacter sp.]